jgi:hypothetical protein
MKPFFKQIKSKGTKTITNIDGEDTILLMRVMSFMMKQMKQGPYEIKVREYMFQKINTLEVKYKFKEILTDLFISQKTTSQNTSQMVNINTLCDKIWEEFIDLYKKQGLETAIYIIFKRYEH